MTTSMFDILCITNRRLCQGDFLKRIKRLAACHPAGIVLREKDLPEVVYEALAKEVLAICKRHGTPCMLHSFTDAAIRLQADSLHLPLPQLRCISPAQRERFSVLGSSCHSVADAQEAEELGCTYITAGHVFDTDCKKGLPGRGLDFLREVCSAVNIPVYAIGGINPENISHVRIAGAAGACVMSGAMTCADAQAYFSAFIPK